MNVVSEYLAWEVGQVLKGEGTSNFHDACEAVPVPAQAKKPAGYDSFRLGDMFDIHPTKSYGMTNPTLFATAGKTPVIINSSRDNGVGGYIGLVPTENGNIITFSDTTTADSIFYQPQAFIGYSHVQGVCIR